MCHALRARAFLLYDFTAALFFCFCTPRHTAHSRDSSTCGWGLALGLRLCAAKAPYGSATGYRSAPPHSAARRCGSRALSTLSSATHTAHRGHRTRRDLSERRSVHTRCSDLTDLHVHMCILYGRFPRAACPRAFLSLVPPRSDPGAHKKIKRTYVGALERGVIERDGGSGKRRPACTGPPAQSACTWGPWRGTR